MTGMIVTQVFWEVRVNGYIWDCGHPDWHIYSQKFVMEEHALAFHQELMTLPITVDGEYCLRNYRRIEDYDAQHEKIRAAFFIWDGAIKPRTAEVYKVLLCEEQIA